MSSLTCSFSCILVIDIYNKIAQAKVIPDFEGNRKKAYFVGDDRENPTIGIGFNLGRPGARKDFETVLTDRDFDAVKNGREELTEEEILALYFFDIKKHTDRARGKIQQFDTFPVYVQTALVNAFFRADIGPKTIALINNERWDDVASEYLNHKEYQEADERGRPGVKKRMNFNADEFRKYAEELKKKKNQKK